MVKNWTYLKFTLDNGKFLCYNSIEVIGMEKKVCRCCGQEYDISFFQKNGKYIRNNCKFCQNKQNREHYHKTIDVQRERSQKYYASHREERIEYNKHLKRKQYSIDGLFRVKTKIRHLIWDAFRRKHFVKSKRTELILGCSFEEFYKHLLSTFYNNYGYEWDGMEAVHIDHIIPLSTAKTEEDIIRLNYYKNLQLLKATDNLHKSSKMNFSLEL